MKAQEILASPPMVILGIALARITPQRLAYWLASKGARSMSRRGSDLFATVRANLAHVVGPLASQAELDALAESAICHAGRTYFDMFRTSLKHHRLGRASPSVDPDEWGQALSALQDDRGIIVVGPHMSSFDLVMQWVTAQGIEIQVLSLAEPDMGTRVINRLRRRRKVVVSPINLHSLRLALTRLKRGGVVLTGVDRPVSADDEPIPFFDAPARLPTGHIRLALQSGARVLVACCIQKPDGAYTLRLHPPLEMEVSGDRREDVRHNARRVLAVVEEMIREAPDQWLMFVPVWREEDLAVNRGQ